MEGQKGDQGCGGEGKEKDGMLVDRKDKMCSMYRPTPLNRQMNHM